MKNVVWARSSPHLFTYTTVIMQICSQALEHEKDASFLLKPIPAAPTRKYLLVKAGKKVVEKVQSLSEHQPFLQSILRYRVHHQHS